MTKIENQVAKLLFGFGFFELFSKFALNLEQNQQNDSVFYGVCLFGSAFGVLLFFHAFLKIWRVFNPKVKKVLYIFTKQTGFKVA